MADRDLKGRVLKLRYGLTTRLSERGAGAVYLGWDEDEGRQVVVRVPHEDLLDDDDFVERFLAPGHVPEGITGLASVLGIDRDGELPYAIVEFVEGETVRERMKSSGGRWAAGDVVVWVRAVGRTLSELHERGITHRGVSPRSIVLSADGGVVLTDVAVASALDEAPSAPEVLEPRVYAAPEASSTRITPESDQFSLAATIATAVMGDGFLSRQGRKGLIAALTTRMPGEAAAALHRALDPEPSGRWPEVGSFVDAFVGAVEAETAGGGMGEGTATMMLGDLREEVVEMLDPLTGEIGEDVPVAEVLPDAEKEPEILVDVGEASGGRTWGLVIGGLVAVALVAGAWFAMQQMKTPAETPDGPPPVADGPADEPGDPAPEPPPAALPPFSAKLILDPAAVPAVTKQEAYEVPCRLEAADGGRVEVNGRRFDPDGAGEVRLKLPLNEGRNEFTVRFFDAHGRPGDDRTLVVDRDTTAPSVTVTSQHASPTAVTSIVVRGRMIDDHPKEVRVGDVVAPVRDDRTFEAEVELKEEGKNTLSIVGFDEVDLPSPERKLAIVRDTGKPVLSIEAPASGEIVKVDSIEVRGTVSDPHLESVTVNGTPVTVGPGGVFSCPVKLEEGGTDIVVVAKDSLDHETKETRVVRRDTTGPGLTITSPRRGEVTSKETILVKGRVQDPDPGMVDVGGVDAKPDPSGWFEAEVTLKPGENRIRIVATDGAGNPSKEEVLVVTLDRTGPEIELEAVPAATKAGEITVAGTVSEDGCTVKVAGRDAVVAGRRFTAVVPLEVGKNAIRIEARDRLENPTTRTLEVTREMPAPSAGAAHVSSVDEGGAVNGEMPPGFPVGLKVGDVVEGPATIETPEKDRLDLTEGSAVLVGGKDGGVHIFTVREGTVGGEIARSTRVKVVQGLLVVPGDERAAIRVAVESEKVTRVKSLDAVVEFHSGGYSAHLFPDQAMRFHRAKAGVFRYSAPARNAMAIIIRADLTEDLRAYVRIPAGLAGRIEPMPGGKRVRFSFDWEEAIETQTVLHTTLKKQKAGEARIEEGKVCLVNRGRHPGRVTVEDEE